MLQSNGEAMYVCMALNHAAEYLSSYSVYDVESCCRVTGKLCMMLNHGAEYLGSYA
jgi:hypothetical protein